jgi:phosphate-selective porin OprO/OprP
VKQLRIALLVWGLLVCCVGLLWADEPIPQPSYADLERRVRELEEIVRRLQADSARTAGGNPTAPNPGQATPGAETRTDDGDGSPLPVLAEASVGLAAPLPDAPGAYQETKGGGSQRDNPFLAGWNNGFLLQSPDKAFMLRLTGQLQGDYRDFLDPGDTTDVDTFLVRRARLGIEATVAKYYEFRLLPDFGQGQARIQDAYMNIHYWDAFQLEAGKFKQPFSYEQLIQDRFVPTLERSLIDQLTPARDVGIMLHGQKLLGDRLDYGLAVSNGEPGGSNGNGDSDNNDYKDLAGRIVLRPFNGPAGWQGLRGLQIGISGTTGIEQEPVIPATLKTPATVPWFKFNPTVRANGLRNRWSPELAYFYGPFGLAAQYLRMEQELQPTDLGPGARTIVDVPFEGYYILATLLLTGEERTTYSQAIEPLAPFDPHCPWAAPGAWELVARLSRLRVGDEVFVPGPAQLADPTRFSSAATELTVGFNWYLTRWVRVQFNWEHARFADPVRLGPGPDGLLKEQDTLLTRLQVIF